MNWNVFVDSIQGSRVPRIPGCKHYLDTKKEAVRGRLGLITGTSFGQDDQNTVLPEVLALNQTKISDN